MFQILKLQTLNEEEGIDLSNPNDQFFNDICMKVKTDLGYDTTLDTRKKYLFMDKSYCEDGCEVSKIYSEPKYENDSSTDEYENKVSILVDKNSKMLYELNIIHNTIYWKINNNIKKFIHKWRQRGKKYF